MGTPDRRPEVMADIAREYRKTRIDTVTNQVLARIFQRDGNEKEGRGSQSLLVYDIYGTPQNPAEGNYYANFGISIRTQIQEATQGFSKTEYECFGILVPALVSALVLDKSLIGKIYDKDLPSIVGIAIDWFNNPDAIDQTHIRVGYGGEEKVGARAPAYLTSAFEIMNRVRQEEGRYGNWAIQHELFDRAGKERADEINEWFIQNIKQSIPDQTTEMDSRQILDEAQNPKTIPFEDMRDVIKRGWIAILGIEAPIEELKEQYHFTDKTPTLVVFNAANAAIEIDKMDKHKVYAARDETQRFLKGYAEIFVPQLASSIIFENDLPWDQHDLYTQMLLLYTNDLVHRVNGHLKPVEERLAQFGKNHQRDEDIHIRGLTPSEYYGLQHASFFKDPQVFIDRAERLPSPRIMEDTEPARNVIYNQGHPEVTFGVYRKLFSEQATISDFTQWLKDRAAKIRNNYGGLAQAILEKARENASKNQRKPFIANLGSAINDLCKDSPQTKRFFISFMGVGSFKQAPDHEEAWAKYADQLQREHPEESEEQLLELSSYLIDQHMPQIRKVLMAANDASDKEDYEAFDQMVTPDQARRIYSGNKKLEMEVTVGKIPVYYFREGVDAIVYPKFSQITLKEYQAMLKDTLDRTARLKGTSRLAITATREALGIDTKDTGGTIPIDGLDNWINEYTIELRKLYSDVDDQEILLKDIPAENLGEMRKQIVNGVRKRVAEIAERRLDVLCRDLGIEITQNILPQKRLVAQVAESIASAALNDLAVEEEKTSAVIRDHQILFGHIARSRGIQDLEQAEIIYNEFLQGFVDSRKSFSATPNLNGHMHTSEIVFATV